MIVRYFLATHGGGYMIFRGSEGLSPTAFRECNECEWTVPGTGQDEDAMTKEQMEWLASYDRKNGSLSTYEARHCGYGDAVKHGFVFDRGPDGQPDLYITAAGRDAVARS